MLYVQGIPAKISEDVDIFNIIPVQQFSRFRQHNALPGDFDLRTVFQRKGNIREIFKDQRGLFLSRGLIAPGRFFMRRREITLIFLPKLLFMLSATGIKSTQLSVGSSAATAA
jgi:hypothetical protein